MTGKARILWFTAMILSIFSGSFIAVILVVGGWLIALIAAGIHEKTGGNL